MGTSGLRLVEHAHEDDVQHRGAAGRDDDALMALAALGDRGAFGALVARHQGAVRRVCWIITGDEALSRDLAQETMLRVWTARQRYVPRGRLRELLMTTARRLALKAMRRRRWLALLGGAAELPELKGPSAPHEALEDEEQAGLVRAALQRLPERFRVPLHLRFVEGLAYDEIARIIRRTPSAARSRVHYGLKALSELLPVEVLG